MKRKIHTDRAPAPVGPYSQAVEVGNVLFLSGQIGIDPETGDLKKDFREQVHQVFRNVEEILKEAGYTMENIVKVTLYLKDISRFKEVNAVYEEFFKNVDPKPARVTVGVKDLPLGADVEVEVIAVKT
ncbi:MAG: RidA family protein [Aquificota bacterium]|nr:RidA family protein [Aquificota bacterium]MDQ7082268.1 RidA family protein [Aquificota bacterium]